MNIDKFPPCFFISGTDTSVGKTFISATLMLGLKTACYWKPIQSGYEDGTDTEWIKQVTGFSDIFFYKEAYCLKTPISPHASAEIDGIKIELEKIKLPELSNASHLIVEGAGGIMVPINWDFTIKDLIKKLNIPVLLVSRTSLGTINHTLLSIEILKKNNIEIIGVILNGKKNDVSKKAIAHFGKVKIIAEIEPIEQISKDNLTKLYKKIFNL
ncbi:MAG: dethiobiotin synthase [Desulfobacterales bacterium]|nr:dethiobiotin synthase [Desulfobacterales bacterium]